MWIWLAILVVALALMLPVVYNWWCRRVFSANHRRIYVEGTLDVLGSLQFREMASNPRADLRSVVLGATAARLTSQVVRMSDAELDACRSSESYRMASQDLAELKRMGIGSDSHVCFRPPGTTGDWHSAIDEYQEIIDTANRMGRGDLAAHLLGYYTRAKGKPLPVGEQEKRALATRVGLTLINMSDKEIAAMREAAASAKAE